MGRKKKEPTPNYRMMFESAVSSLQYAYTAHKKAVSEELRWTFFDNNGRYAVLDGYKERHQKTEDTMAEVNRLIQVVEDLRMKLGGDTE